MKQAMSKKIVHYKGEYTLVGDRAMLTPVDHPDEEHVSNTKPVLTSRVVISNHKTGIVETQNTIYHPVKEQ